MWIVYITGDLAAKICIEFENQDLEPVQISRYCAGLRRVQLKIARQRSIFRAGGATSIILELVTQLMLVAIRVRQCFTMWTTVISICYR